MKTIEEILKYEDTDSDSDDEGSDDDNDWPEYVGAYDNPNDHHGNVVEITGDKWSKDIDAETDKIAKKEKNQDKEYKEEPFNYSEWGDVSNNPVDDLWGFTTNFISEAKQIEPDEEGNYNVNLSQFTENVAHGLVDERTAKNAGEIANNLTCVENFNSLENAVAKSIHKAKNRRGGSNSYEEYQSHIEIPPKSDY